jgi:hypothetical protein
MTTGMPQSTKISFVVFPEGKVDERSLTVCGEEMARERFILEWLPESTFGRDISGYALASIWQSCAKNGCRSYTLEIGPNGEPQVVKS